MTSLKELQFEPDRLEDSARFAIARVMSPVEVAAAIEHQPADMRDALACRWMVCGDMTADAFDRLRQRGGAELPWRFSGFTSTEGIHYAVLMHQFGNYQHRFVLPTWNSSVRSFMRAIGKGEPYGFMFGRGGGEAAWVVFGQASRATFAPVQRLLDGGCSEALQRRGIAELPRALHTLGRSDAIPSIVPGCVVQRVSVSVALSPLSGERATWAH